MIKLEQISTERLVAIVQRKSANDQKFLYIYKLLENNNIKNYQELFDLLDKLSFGDDCYGVLDYLRNQLIRIEKKIGIINHEQKKLEIFTFNNYNGTILDEETIRKTDDETLGAVLSCINPIPAYTTASKGNKLKCLSITELKRQLSFIDDRKLENIFRLNVSTNGKIQPDKVASSIIFYEEQVLRQAEETGMHGVNLFYLNQSDKIEIIETEIKDIVEYLTDQAIECVWGEFTSTQKRCITSAMKDTKSDYLRTIRNNLINMISNYTTLTELKKGVIKTKKIDRFIIKKQ